MTERTAFLLGGALCVASLYGIKASLGDGASIIAALVVIAYTAVALNRDRK
jgi:hypothetical protein